MPGGQGREELDVLDRDGDVAREGGGDLEQGEGDDQAGQVQRLQYQFSEFDLLKKKILSLKIFFSNGFFYSSEKLSWEISFRQYWNPISKESFINNLIELQLLDPNKCLKFKFVIF